MKTKLTIGWLLFATGTLFLLSGLVVMIFATITYGGDGPMIGELPDLSFWPSLANAVMMFVIEMLKVEWSPARVGAFLIVVGLILDGGGAFFITSSEPKGQIKP